MNITNITIVGLPLIWSGVSLGGNLIVAPAKFRVEALEMPIALQVGRAQFTWVGYAEWVLLFLVIAGLILKMKVPAVALAVAIAVFLVQKFWMQPLLEARSDVIIQGGDAGDSQFHLFFIAAEFIKFMALFWAGFVAISVLGFGDQSQVDS